MLKLRSEGMIDLPCSIRRSLKIFAALVLVCCFAEIVCRLHYHNGFPYVWPLMPYYPPFEDFTILEPRFASFHTGSFFSAPGFPFTYPAPLALAFAALFRCPWPLRTFLFSILLGFASATAIFVRALRREGLSNLGTFAVISAFAVSFPMWFELEQANSESVVWLIGALGLWAFLRDRSYAAAACFSIAGSMKLFPFVFLGLLLARRQYKQLAFGCFVGLTLTAGSLWLETGSMAASWRGTSAGLEYFRQHYVLTINGFDHSLFQLGKRIFSVINFMQHGTSKIPAAEVAPMLRLYLPAVALAGMAIFFARIRKLPVMNQILALTVASILLPPVSFDYTLIHLYAPCALLLLIAVRSAKRGVPVPGLLPTLLTMSVLLAPETEVIARAVTLGGEIKCLALLALFFLAIQYPFDLDPLPTSEDVMRSSYWGDRTLAGNRNF